MAKTPDVMKPQVHVIDGKVYLVFNNELEMEDWCNFMRYEAESVVSFGNYMNAIELK